MDEQAARLAGGEAAAFAALYDACAGRLHHYLVVRLGRRDEADEVLQEVFVRLARSRARFATVADPVLYAFATARNEALRALGRRGRRERRRVELSAEMLFCEAADDDIAARERAEWAAAALDRLDERGREVVELKLFAGLTFREIAAVTGLPQGTVATRYRAALERMRQWAAREEE